MMEKYNKMGNDFTWQMKKEGTEIVFFGIITLSYTRGTANTPFLKFLLMHKDFHKCAIS